MRIWYASDVVNGSKYRLALCQNAEGRRYFQLISDRHIEINEDAVFTTEVVSNELLRARNLAKIARSVTLVDGKAFSVDAHGIWYTQEEARQLSSNVAPEDFVWSTASVPKFAGSR